MDEPEIEMIEVQWWEIGVPIPEGWRLCESLLQSHHNEYSVLIERVFDD